MAARMGWTGKKERSIKTPSLNVERVQNWVIHAKDCRVVSRKRGRQIVIAIPVEASQQGWAIANAGQVRSKFPVQTAWPKTPDRIEGPPFDPRRQSPR